MIFQLDISVTSSHVMSLALLHLYLISDLVYLGVLGLSLQ